MSDAYKYPLSLLSLPVLEPKAPPANPPAAAKVRDDAPASDTAPLSSDRLDRKLLEGKVIQALREIYDPEIPVNIYELGLIYEIKVNADDTVNIKMTLTAPACPVAGSLPGEVEKKVEEIPEVKSADVELVWEPAWSRDLMSEAALLTLGML
ncbi:MAG TPA: SUF system Fe-S cluster assembly protein [Tepidisphaeraceae bacterium]|jgi:FeS assembly SUF system protein|nr:SUF system Fe-S cluster assembly protein [Tepidisphaeraceae bacterium]